MVVYKPIDYWLPHPCDQIEPITHLPTNLINSRPTYLSDYFLYTYYSTYIYLTFTPPPHPGASNYLISLPLPLPPYLPPSLANQPKSFPTLTNTPIYTDCATNNYTYNSIPPSLSKNNIPTQSHPGIPIEPPSKPTHYLPPIPLFLPNQSNTPPSLPLYVPLLLISMFLAPSLPNQHPTPPRYPN